MNWFPGTLQIIDLNIFDVFQSLLVITFIVRLSKPITLCHLAAM